MEDMRPCPFCAHAEPVISRDVDGRELVTCPECGAVGPRALPDDPPGHAAFSWNLRFGADH
jgi:hypothetical protein